MEPFLLNPDDKGTIPQIDNFDPFKDAERLQRAAKGPGTDEKTFIDILTNRNTRQRQAIAGAFNEKYKKLLFFIIREEFAAYMEATLVALVSKPSWNDAKSIKNAVKGSGTDEDTLVEIICTRSIKERQDILTVYPDLFGPSAITDIRNDTSGLFRDLLCTVLTAKLDPAVKENDDTAREDARKLFRDNIHPNYVALFAVRSLAHMRKVNEEFHKISPITVGDAFMKEANKDNFPGDYIKAFGDIMLIINDKALYLASRILHAVKGPGTKEDQVIRVLVSRCDKDLMNIRESYDKHMGGLRNAIQGDFSGDVRDCLLSLVK